VATVGLSTLGLGLAVHAASGVAEPAVPILLALAALAVLAATLIAQAHPPTWAVLLLLGVAQQILHWALGGASSSLSGGAGHHGGEIPLSGTATSQAHSPQVMLMLHTHPAIALLLSWAVARYPRITGWVSGRAKRERTLRAEEGAPVA